MNSYKIFLTKSHECASTLSAGFKVGINGVAKISFGNASGIPYIPEMYQNISYYFCCIEFETSNNIQPDYKIIFC